MYPHAHTSIKRWLYPLELLTHNLVVGPNRNLRRYRGSLLVVLSERGGFPERPFEFHSNYDRRKLADKTGFEPVTL